MCGIVGYIGPQDPKEIILSGLKCLEYRGYDSAGVSILHQGEFKRVRAHGKLGNLAEKLKTETFDGHTGIGHTRWATHGVPSERNAHPHKVGKVSIVHNGIIENYLQIRQELTDAGIKIESDTDSELIAHLLNKEVDRGLDLFSAVKAILPKIHGAFAVLAVSEKEPDSMVAFKNGPPLICGSSAKEFIIASDIQAIVSYTKKAMYLADDEILVVKGTEYQFYDFDGNKVKKEIEEIDWTNERAEKEGYPHYMLKEINEQPRAVAQAMAPHVDIATYTTKFEELGVDKAWLAGIEKVYIVACGTSFYSGFVAKYAIEKLARIPVEIDVASEFRYRDPILAKKSIVIVVSQSGETADTLAALRLVNEMGVPTISVCNVKNSTIDRESKGSLYMNSGPEIGVASTKAFTSTLTVLELFAIYLARVRNQLKLDEEKTLVQEIVALPSQIEIVLAYSKFFASASKTLKEHKGFLYLARSINYPIALEGALKLKELCYMHAEGYAAGEMKHGPLALIDKNMAIVVIAPRDDLYEKTVSGLEEAKARGGQIISIGTGEDKKLSSISRHYLSLPKCSWLVSPILTVIPLQLMAYHMSEALGHDVDQPRNLAKSVTVE